MISRNMDQRVGRALLVSVGAVLIVGLAFFGFGRGTSAEEVSVSAEAGAEGTDSALGDHDLNMSGPARLTPRPEELPVLPSEAEVIATGLSTPVDQRETWIIPGGEGEFRSGWAAAGHDGRAFYLYEEDGTPAGVFVSNLGVVDRDVYESEGFDPEAELRVRMGDDYQAVTSAAAADIDGLPATRP